MQTACIVRHDRPTVFQIPQCRTVRRSMSLQDFEQRVNRILEAQVPRDVLKKYYDDVPVDAPQLEYFRAVRGAAQAITTRATAIGQRNQLRERAAAPHVPDAPHLERRRLADEKDDERDANPFLPQLG